jgi:hypothetical protein
MNILKESLFSSSESNSSAKTRKTRQNRSTSANKPNENDALSEPLLSPLENDDNSIELGTIDLDDDEDDTPLNIQRVTRSRHVKHQPTSPAHGGGSIVIVEKPIQPQETIQAFAIRYRVPVCLILYFSSINTKISYLRYLN